MATSAPTLAGMTRGVTKIDEITTVLRAEIAAGVYDQDGKLPSEGRLAEQYGVAKITVREVYRKLTAEGLIYPVERRGYYVRRMDPLLINLNQYEQGDAAAARDGLDQWATAVAAAGRRPLADVTVHIMDDTTPAAPMVRGLLELSDPDVQVVLRKRTCYVDGAPFMTRDSYFRETDVRGTRLMRNGDQAAPGGLFAEIGIKVDEFRDRWLARMPNDDETQRLHLPPATPGMQWIRVRHGHSTKSRAASAARPVAVMVAFLPGDRIELADILAAG